MKLGSLTSRGVAFFCVTCVIGYTAHASDWLQSGNDRTNSRYQADEKKISPANVGNLQVKWVVTTGGDVSSTPSVEGRSVYFGDWAGNLFKVNARNGAIDWKVSLGDYTGFPGDFTRHTPAITDKYIITGNQIGRFGQGGAKLIAINKNTAKPAWVTQLDPNPTTMVTSSPMVQGGVAYVGVASFEEGLAAFVPAQYFQFTFRGSIVAVKVATGEILWQTYMTVPGYSGAAVWGSSPAIDLMRQQLYVTTGNNYSAPDAYHQCIEAAGNDLQAAEACNDPGNHVDSVLALDLMTGAIKWATRVIPYDTWNVACVPFLVAGIPGANPPGSEDNCVNGGGYTPGPDFDFAQGPILYSTADGDRVGAGQKSGVYWSLDPDNGSVVWSTRTGPGGLAGGHQWGSAADGQRIYTSNANSFGFAPPPIGPGPYELIDGTLTTAGIFSALDGATGQVLWQTANPTYYPAGAPASVANGVMYACSGDPDGYMYALDAANGSILWSFASGGTCGGGASIANGMVFWGSGYTALGGPGNNKLYAFGL